jgi:hypothetical protein
MLTKSETIFILLKMKLMKNTRILAFFSQYYMTWK